MFAQHFINFWDQNSWLFQSIATLLVTLVIYLIEKYLYRRLTPKVLQRNKLWDEALLHATHQPLGMLIWVLGLCYVLEITKAANIKLHVILLSPETFRAIAFTLIIIWFLIRFIQKFEHALIQTNQHKKQFDQTSIIAIGQILRVSIIIVGILIILAIFGIPLSGVLAFGGFSGIAIGFAAKDTVANILGGLMIYFDKPFKVGDWVRSPDKDIEGHVEYIGWRLTRIRTLDKRPIYIPNGLFSNIVLENASRMSHRRIKFLLDIRYQDINKIASLNSAIEKMLRHHAKIDSNETIVVRLNGLGASALQILVDAFTKETDYALYHAMRQEIYFNIMQIIAEHGADCAYPTTTVLLTKTETN